MEFGGVPPFLLADDFGRWILSDVLGIRIDSSPPPSFAIFWILVSFKPVSTSSMQLMVLIPHFLLNMVRNRLFFLVTKALLVQRNLSTAILRWQLFVGIINKIIIFYSPIFIYKDLKSTSALIKWNALEIFQQHHRRLSLVDNRSKTRFQNILQWMNG